MIQTVFFAFFDEIGNLILYVFGSNGYVFIRYNDKSLRGLFGFIIDEHLYALAVCARL